MESESEERDLGCSREVNLDDDCTLNGCDIEEKVQDNAESRDDKLTSGNGNRPEKVDEDEPDHDANSSGRKKRTGEEVIETSCMICYAPCEQNPKVRRNNPGISTLSATGIGGNDGDKPTGVVEDEDGDIFDPEGDKNHVDSQMGVMFVLRRLLLFPKSTCEELLETYGTPSGWNTAFCSFCANTIEEAQEIAEKISNYQMKFKCLQERFKDEILISAQEQVVPMDMDTSAVVEDIRQRFVQRNGYGPEDSDAFVTKPSKEPSGQNINTSGERESGIYPDEGNHDPFEPDLSSVKVEAWDDEEDAEPFTAWDDLPEPASVCQVTVNSVKDESEESESSSEHSTRTRPVPNQIQRTSRFKAKGRSNQLTGKKQATNKFKCPLCIGRFSSVQLMNSHYANKHSGKVALKSTGGWSRKRKVSSRHSGSSERESENGDEKDSKQRPSRGERKYHFKCQDCPQRFPSEYFRDAHHRRRHLNIRLCFICDLCGKAFARNESILTHKKTCEGDGTFVHPDAKLQEIENFKCPKCPRHYPSEITMQAHLKRLHMGIKFPYECKVEGCKKAFRRPVELAAHEIRCTKGDKGDEVSADGDNIGLDKPLQKEVENDKDEDRPRKKEKKTRPTKRSKSKSSQRPNKRSKSKSSDGLSIIQTDLEIKLQFECKVDGCRKGFKSKRLLTAHETCCTKSNDGDEVTLGGENSGSDEPEDENELDLDSDYEESGSDQQEKKSSRKNKLGSNTKAPKEYKCPISNCNEVFAAREARDGHVKKVHEGITRGFTCEVCGKGFIKLKSLKDHLPIHSSVGNPFKCEKCGKELSTENSLKVHNKLLHEEVELLKCDKCDRVFKSNTNLVRHQRIVHEKRRNFICDSCGDSFPTSSRLTYHKHSKHWKELNLEPYKCDICDPVRYFTQPHFKIQHYKLVHTKSYTLFCSFCNQGFINHSSLNRHKLNHTGRERACICEVCGKGFPKASEVQRHMRMHTGEKPFCCEHCGKQYFEERDLKKHMIKHEPPKFECDVCLKKYFYSGKLSKHRKIHDPGHQPSKASRRGRRKKEPRFHPTAQVDDESSTSNASSIDQDFPIPSTANQQSRSFQNHTPNPPFYVANGSIPNQHHLPTPQAAHSHSNRIEFQSQAHPLRHGHASAFGSNNATDLSGRQYHHDPIAHWLNIM